jgi:hypothetical protein
MHARRENVEYPIWISVVVSAIGNGCVVVKERERENMYVQ